MVFNEILVSPDSEININQKYPEFNEWKWVDLDELPRLIVPFKKNFTNL